MYVLSTKKSSYFYFTHPFSGIRYCVYIHNITYIYTSIIRVFFSLQQTLSFWEIEYIYKREDNIPCRKYFFFCTRIHALTLHNSGTHVYFMSIILIMREDDVRVDKIHSITLFKRTTSSSFVRTIFRKSLTGTRCHRFFNNYI